MKLRQLECLCAVVDAGFNISRAAATLHATQPAVGQQLRQLEEELGVDLLVRQHGRPVGLTEVGERTIIWARRSLQSAESFRTAVTEARAGETGSIVLTTTHTLANYLLPPVLADFTRAFPRVRIVLQQGLADQASQLVREGTVVFALTNHATDVPAEVVSIPFRNLELSLLVPAGHPLLASPQLTLAEIAAHPLIVQNPSRLQGLSILRAFTQAGHAPNVRVETPDATVTKSYVRAGLGVAILPDLACDVPDDSALVARDASHLFDPSCVAVVLKRNTHLPEYVYAFLERLDASLDRKRVQALTSASHA